ncbi:hypothetical protein G7072_00205 [Nocardioides sp. HDW12B]|uniref:lipopolysaccharide biosynthesis protein n=1 Tax=Nocardioides sp. HDW12B TaxID=2714939 RepID=UPI00140E38E9|nr:hypothetical protein [Nocardioides sp. HDW12B]QIK64965.1 hypothetical protein G7072_00205 [Nocardioides sp. HDW12B]
MSSRTSKALLNMGVGLGVQLVLLLSNLLNRTYFVRTLEIDVLGVHALFQGLIALATIIEFGLSTSLMYVLYRPLEAGNERRTAALVSHGARLYRRVAAGVLVVGILPIPFLSLLTTAEIGFGQLAGYYLVLLCGSAASFLMAHRVTLLLADQRAFVSRLYFMAVDLTRSGLQIAALIAIQSYLAYVLIQVAGTVIYNLAVYSHVGRAYPYVNKSTQSIDDETRRDVRESISAMMVYRVCGVLISNTDAVMISIIVGSAALGFYSNYALIIGAVVMATEIMFRGVAAGVGNLIASRDRVSALGVFWELSLVAYVVFSSATLVLWSCLDDFVALWLGERFTISREITFVALANFYLLGNLLPILVYRTGTGLFKDTKYILVFTAALNLFLSILGGVVFGVAGVLAATFVARILTNWWYEPWRLLREHLGASPWRHYAAQLIGALLVVAQGALYSMVPFDNIGGAIFTLIAESLIVGSASVLLTALLFSRTQAARALRVRSKMLLRGS